MGESATAIPWVNVEHNPNNTVADVNWNPWFNGPAVWGGRIDSAGDVDYWDIFWYAYYQYCLHCTEETSLPVLIDIEAQSIGSPVDPAFGDVQKRSFVLVRHAQELSLIHI